MIRSYVYQTAHSFKFPLNLSFLSIHFLSCPFPPKMFFVPNKPLEFKPERFLPGGEKADVDVRGNDFEVIPFGAGRRIYDGMSLGLRMVQLLTATLAHAFDWSLADGLNHEKLNMDEAYGLTRQRAAPLIVHPRPRL